MVRRGDIYLVDLGGAVGSEQSNTRPAIILQNDIGNDKSPTTVIVPLSTKRKPSMASTHVEISTEQGVKNTSEALCEQVRVVDKTRLIKKVGEISDEQVFSEIGQKINVVCGF